VTDLDVLPPHLLLEFIGIPFEDTGLLLEFLWEEKEGER
jgi:hypothetical protein